MVSLHRNFWHSGASRCLACLLRDWAARIVIMGFLSSS